MVTQLRLLSIVGYYLSELTEIELQLYSDSMTTFDSPCSHWRAKYDKNTDTH